ncbi:MAG: exodeoxyribonuclease III [Alphaproteobacteria bacterium]
MRIATWNINSVRIRIPLLERLVADENPDVICLQETKVPDELFPLDAIQALGFPHIAKHGMKGYNGVAILSRRPFLDTGTRDCAGKTDCRHIHARLPLSGMADGIELHNLYVPAGGDIPDPASNEKFDHKLRFVDELADWFPATRRADQPLVLVGDLNIAPLETDVWSHKQLLDVVSHTPIEVEKLTRVQTAMPWIDTTRHFIPEPQRLYSWWSYRARDWAESDRGRRLDHIWVTPPLLPFLAAGRILREVRGWEKASDHVPVILDLAETP